MLSRASSELGMACCERRGATMGGRRTAGWKMVSGAKPGEAGVSRFPVWRVVGRQGMRAGEPGLRIGARPAPPEIVCDFVEMGPSLRGDDSRREGPACGRFPEAGAAFQHERHTPSEASRTRDEELGAISVARSHFGERSINLATVLMTKRTEGAEDIGLFM